jgi:predicted acetyltransferase
VVPWKRGRGYATAALRAILPVARSEGLARVLITCDDDNEASRRVILANGGMLAGSTRHPSRPRHRKLAYWVSTERT